MRKSLFLGVRKRDLPKEGKMEEPIHIQTKKDEPCSCGFIHPVQDGCIVTDQTKCECGCIHRLMWDTSGRAHVIYGLEEL